MDRESSARADKQASARAWAWGSAICSAVAALFLLVAGGPALIVLVMVLAIVPMLVSGAGLREYPTAWWLSNLATAAAAVVVAILVYTTFVQDFSAKRPRTRSVHLRSARALQGLALLVFW